MGNNNTASTYEKPSFVPDSNSEGQVRQIDTHLGTVLVRIVWAENKNDPNKAPVVCLPGASPALVDEWVKVAVELSKEGYTVCIINFHSNISTKPGILFGGIQPEDVSKIINEAVLEAIFQSEKGIIMGKSWGGYMAYTHAATHPSKVEKLCLQAPAFSNDARIAALAATKIPTFLAWARDDPLIWYSTSDAWLSGMGDLLTFFSTDTGGHSIVHEYIEPIIKFIQS